MGIAGLKRINLQTAYYVKLFVQYVVYHNANTLAIGLQTTLAVHLRVQKYASWVDLERTLEYIKEYKYLFVITTVNH